MRGILFQPDMVLQIIAKKKRQTRRIIKPQPGDDLVHFECDPDSGVWLGDTDDDIEQGNCSTWFAKCPYGKPGDVLAVREAWRAWKEYDDLPPRDIRGQETFHYEADGVAPECFGRYRHARFMPLDLARIKLTLSSVLIERLRDITEEDASAEGVTPSITSPGFECRAAFQTLWVRINGQPSWDANPYVWVLGWG